MAITTHTAQTYDENAASGSSVGTNRKAITLPDTFDEWRQFTNLLSEDHEDLSAVVTILNNESAARQGDGHYTGAANTSTFFDDTADTSVSITTVSGTSGTGLTQFFVKSEKTVHPRSRITIGQEIDDSDAILEFKAKASGNGGGGIVYSSAGTDSDYFSSVSQNETNFYRISSDGSRHRVFSYPSTNGTVEFAVAPTHLESFTFSNTTQSSEVPTLKYISDGFADINNFLNVNTTGLASADILKYNGYGFVPVNDRDSITKIAVNSGTAIVGATNDTSNTAETIKLSGTSSDLVQFEQGTTASNVTPVTVKLNLAQAATANGILPKANYEYNEVDLGDLKNVTVTTPADNEVVAYDSTSAKFINQTAAEAGLATSSHTHTQYLHNSNGDFNKTGVANAAEHDSNSTQFLNGQLVIDSAPTMAADSSKERITARAALRIVNDSSDTMMGIDQNEIFTSDGNLYLRAANNSSTNGLRFNDSIVWHAGNDGSGSGLDADKLDGQQGSYYAPKASPALTGVPTAPTAAVGTNTTQIATTAFMVNELQSNATYSGINVNADGDTLGAIANGDTLLFKDSTYSKASMSAKTSLGGSPEQFAHNIVITPTAVQSRGAFATAASGNTTNATQNRGTGLFHYFVTGSASSGLPDTNHFNILNFGGETADSFNYQANIALSGDGSKMYVRTNTTVNYGDWKKIWTELNDGANSGLDADKLDGVDGSGYSLINHNHDGTYIKTAGSAQNVSGSLRINTDSGSQPFVLTRHGTYFTTPSGTDQPQHVGMWVEDAGLTYHIENDEDRAQFKIILQGYDTETGNGVDATQGTITMNQSKSSGTRILVGDHVVFHEGNDGPGSGLDADKLDGLEGSAFATSGHNHDTTYLKLDGVNTLTGNLNVGDGNADTRILIKKADNNEADHIQFYNGTTRVGEIGCLDNTWLRINQETAKNIYTPRSIRADGGFFVDNISTGINGSGNFIGGTITGASDANVTQWDAAYTHSQATHAPSNAEANEFSFKTISIAGESDVVADSDADTLTLVAGDAITLTTSNDTITIAHSNTSSQASVNNSNQEVIQDITLDARGHVTALGSKDLSSDFIQTDNLSTTDTQQTVGTNLTVNRQLRIGSANDDTDSLIRFYSKTTGGSYNKIIGYDPAAAYFYISTDNGTTENKIWHAGNDGPGSGLDADKLDGLSSDNFMRNRGTISNIYNMANTSSSVFDDSTQVSWTIRNNATTNYGWPENANYNVLSVGESQKFTQFAGQTDSNKVFHRNSRSGSTNWYEMWTKANLTNPVEGTATDGSAVNQIRTISQANYDGLSSKDANTLYLVTA